MAFDLSTLDSKAASEAGTTIEIISPATGEPLLDDGEPVTITIIGIDSAKLRGIARKLNDRRMTDIRKGKNADFDSEVADEEKAKLYAAATIEWEGIALDGSVLECSERNAKKLYSDPRFPWLVEQIDKAIADRQRFFKTASPNS